MFPEKTTWAPSSLRTFPNTAFNTVLTLNYSLYLQLLNETFDCCPPPPNSQLSHVSSHINKENKTERDGGGGGGEETDVIHRPSLSG